MFYQSYGGGGGSGSSPAAEPGSMNQQLSYASQTPVVNNNRPNNMDQLQSRTFVEGTTPATKLYDSLEVSGDIHSSSVQSTYP